MQNANRVFVNTIIQYVQLVLNVIIGLVSVRLILAALGEVDYGIYDVVGGVVGLFAFVKGTLSQASMRFISIRIGENNTDSIRHTFSSCFWLHVVIAAIICVLLEIAGVFLFKGFLNIPSDRIFAARIVFHCVTLSLFFNIAITPFLAILYAYEQFWFTSVIAILNSVLKLVVAFIISYWYADKLVLYAFLLFAITIIDFILNFFFAFHKHKWIITVAIPRSSDIRDISSFIGWTLLDSIASVAQRQGYALMLNRFFGPIVNTSYALAKQIDNHLYAVSSSVIATMKPQIMKSYGRGEESRMFRLSMTAGKIGFALMSMISIPLIVMMPDILTIWLKSYPKDTVLFSQLLLAACMFEQMTRGLVFANQAVGNIKWFSIIVSSIRISALPISCVLLFMGAPAYYSIIVFMLCELIASISRVFILSKISNYERQLFWSQVLMRIVPPVIVSIVFCILLYRFLPNSIICLLFILVINACVYGSLIYYLGLTKEEKVAVIGILDSVKTRLFIKR